MYPLVKPVTLPGKYTSLPSQLAGQKLNEKLHNIIATKYMDSFNDSIAFIRKDEYRKDWQSSEEVLSVHHALAERAQDYTKRPHVFRLQTADWRVFLFEAQ